MIFAKDELKLLWPFYLVTALVTIFNVVPIFWVVYFQLKGFSISDVSFALAFLSIATFIFEIPTGAIADIFGRKRSVVLGCFLIGLGVFLIPFVNSVILLDVLFLFWGVAFTLPSGAEDAWVVDGLRQKRKRNLIQKYYTKKNIITAIAFMFTGIMATFLAYSFDFGSRYKIFGLNLLGSDFLWFAEAVVYFISGLILLIFAHEKFKRGKSRVKEEFLRSLRLSKEGVRYSIRHPVIFGILLSSLILVVANSFWSIGFQPFLYNLGFDIKNLGLLYVSSAAIALVFSLLTERLSVKFRRKGHYIALITVFEFFLTLSIIRVFGIWAAIAFSLMKWNFQSLRQPVINPFLQEHIPSNKRATVGSVKSVFENIGQFIGLIIVGIVMEGLGPRMSIFYSTFLLVLVALIYLRMRE
jgi:MFS family permease